MWTTSCKKSFTCIVFFHIISPHFQIKPREIYNLGAQSNVKVNHMEVHIHSLWYLVHRAYRIDRNFGGELNLAVWQSNFATAKLKFANISYLHICVWWFLTKPPNLNPPIFLCNGDLGPNCQIYFPPIFPAIRYITSRWLFLWVLINVFQIGPRMHNLYQLTLVHACTVGV